jgi:hypothetical protein
MKPAGGGRLIASLSPVSMTGTTSAARSPSYQKVTASMVSARRGVHGPEKPGVMVTLADHHRCAVVESVSERDFLSCPPLERAWRAPLTAAHRLRHCLTLTCTA